MLAHLKSFLVIKRIRTDPLSLSVGSCPFITVGELGANLEYLRIIAKWRISLFLYLLECVEVNEGVTDSVSEDQLLQVVH